MPHVFAKYSKRSAYNSVLTKIGDEKCTENDRYDMALLKNVAF